MENVDGVEGKLKVWIRRVWTLEMVRLSSHLFALDPLFPTMITDFDHVQSVIGLR